MLKNCHKTEVAIVFSSILLYPIETTSQTRSFGTWVCPSGIDWIVGLWFAIAVIWCEWQVPSSRK